MTRNNTLGSARDRLIESAGGLFARKGFQGASVREICGQAKVNLSAIDYYFGGKEGLYREICAYVLQRFKLENPVDCDPASDADAAGRLRSFVSTYIARACNEQRRSWEQQLMHREIMNPTAIGRKMIAPTLRAEVETLKGIIRELVGKKIKDSRIELCVLSIMGQCHFHAHYRRHKGGGFQGSHLLSLTNQEIAEHISRFSLAGLLSAER